MMIRIRHNNFDFKKEKLSFNDYQAQQINRCVYSKQKSSISIFRVGKEEFVHIYGICCLLRIRKRNGGRADNLSKDEESKKMQKFLSFALCKSLAILSLRKINSKERHFHKLLNLCVFRQFALASMLKLKAKKIKEEMSLKENFSPRENYISL